MLAKDLSPNRYTYIVVCSISRVSDCVRVSTLLGALSNIQPALYATSRTHTRVLKVVLTKAIGVRTGHLNVHTCKFISLFTDSLLAGYYQSARSKAQQEFIY